MFICPFCGVATETPHETQEGCIDALNVEIAKMRAVLEHVRSAVVPGPVLREDDSEDDRRTV